jgi:hypothetical protein
VDKSPTPGEIVIMASGAVALIFSFFDFYDNVFGGGVSAWSSSLFPLATYIAIIGVIMAAQVALTKFANVSLPDRVLGFTWPQLHIALGFFTVLIAVGFLIVDLGPDKAIGFWISLIASIGLLVGAILLSKERSGAPGTPPAA